MTDQREHLAHRMRTELTTISLAGQLLRRDRLASDRQRRLATEVVRACDRLQECLEALLELDERA